MQSDLIFFEGKKEMQSIQSYTKRRMHLIKANVRLTKPMSAENISWRRCSLFDLKCVLIEFFLCKKLKQINSQAYPAAGPLNKKS